ncbi:MAG TPA: ATPase, T2SS/T4P/T4SS family [Kofleriaceae bacterium]|nr:ATPase, T2SS/T4P/T4SS family [Kofleriaceae bacterium]
MSAALRRSISIALPDGSVVTRHGAAVIGRDPGCDVVLASAEVSRRHAAVEVTGTGAYLTDNSANGTLVADQLVVRTTVPLEPTAALQIGPYRLLLEIDGGGPPPAHFSLAAHTPPPAAPPSGALHIRVPGELRRRIHRALLDHLDLVSLDRKRMDERLLRPKVQSALRLICRDLAPSLSDGADLDQLITEMTDEALGLGPLEQLLADDSVSEIMVVTPQTVFVERSGKIELTDLRFTDDEAVRAVIERIVTPLGRRIDESTPLVDARLKDGSRVNGIIRPLAVRGACITIRKFARKPLVLDDLIIRVTLTPQIARFLTRAVAVRKNILVSGGTGSGKTTLLNVLSSAIPTGERIVTIEDAAELRLPQIHVVSLEARPQNLEGKGEVTIRDLVKNALRMRPDRIIVGECRGAEALDMMQAMNTGHEGSMTTLHANNPREALARLETLCLMAGLALPSRAVREQIAQSIHLVVHQARLSDGTRRITSVSEVAGLDQNGELRIREIFGFVRTGTHESGEVLGEFRMTGYLPSFLDEFLTHGLIEGEGDVL